MVNILRKFINAAIFNYIAELESRIDELENRLQAKIDKIRPVVYNIVNKDKNV